METNENGIILENLFRFSELPSKVQDEIMSEFEPDDADCWRNQLMHSSCLFTKEGKLVHSHERKEE